MCKTGINQASEGIYIQVRFHLMKNAEFSTLNDFPCFGANYFGVLEPYFPFLSQCCKYTKTGIN